MAVSWSVEASLTDLRPRISELVDRALDRLAAEPDSGKPLHGPLRGRRAFHVGTVRIIYRYKHSELLVFGLEIAQRQGVYG